EVGGALVSVAVRAWGRGISARAGGCRPGCEGIGLLEARRLEPADVGVLATRVPLAQRHPDAQQGARGQRAFELIQCREAELRQIALAHGQCRLAEPEVVPEPPARVLPLSDLQGELVARGVTPGREQLATQAAADILPRGDGGEVGRSLCVAPEVVQVDSGA